MLNVLALQALDTVRADREHEAKPIDDVKGGLSSLLSIGCC